VQVTPVTKASDIRKRLLMLINECQSFQWATAWAGESEVLDAAIASKKMASMVIGTHQYFTAPEVLDKCVGISEVRVMYPTGPMFHPKLYAFNLGDRVEVFVGSSNLTLGGLARNIECGVFLNSESHSAALRDLLAHVHRLWKNAEELDHDFIRSYKANHLRVRNAKKALDDFVAIKRPKRSGRSANDIDPQDMDWSKFVELVNTDEKFQPEARLEVLSQARQLFAKPSSFADLDETERKCLAGILKPSIRDGVDWAFFGQMSAYGNYSPILQRHTKQFSKALDQIPLQGEVRREHYDAYLTAFKKIPGASKTWIGMGTRLLAMKRPDYFVCIDSANRGGLCDYFSSAPTTTNLDNYWTRIIAPMMSTPWWQSDMPDGKLEQQIWMGRAAMLDAIYYTPE